MQLLSMSRPPQTTNTQHHAPRLKLKPRQLKRQKLRELLLTEEPQPEIRPEPVRWNPLG
jgi:hypothetical protein